MAIHLTTIPGFADVPDTALKAEQAALAAHLARMASNAAFGMVRLECFVGLYKNGDTVQLPISAVDGYVYSPAELSYLWTIQNTANPSTNWITGPDSLWYCAWLVDQATGLVSTLETYRRSGSNYQAQSSNDGTICVFTVAQRQKTTLLVSAPLNTFTDIADSGLAQDKPWATSLAKRFNNNAKFGCLTSEVIYMGEFTNGQTVGTPTSPADGYAYTRAETTLVHCWRWTTVGSAFQVPDLNNGQLGPLLCSINQSTGVVSITVQMIDNNNSLISPTGYGRIAVFAFASRKNLITGLPGGSNNAFAEQDYNLYTPGQSLRASTLLQLNKNIREGALSPEFFGPTSYVNGGFIPLAVSPIDGYTYTRDEMFYVWDWSDTTPAGGTNLRVPLFSLDTSALPVVSITEYRLPPGGPYVLATAGLQHIDMTVIAVRGGTHNVPAGSTSTNPGNSGTGIDQNAPVINPYLMCYDVGPGNAFGASAVVLEHVVGTNLNSVSLPASLGGSVAGARVAPVGASAITIKKNGVSAGTINFAAGATTATFTFSATVTLVPGDVLTFTAPATPDGSGYFWTISGLRQ